MKNLFSFILFTHLSLTLFSQEIYKSSQTEISFFSETPVENIDAISKEGKALLNTKTNELVFITAIIEFKFKKPLMEEHFNESYMESNQYKTAHFKGKIIEEVDYSKDGEFSVKARGILNIHGVDKEREIAGTIVIKNGVIELNASFDVDLKDHQIKIPKIVVKNIAEKVKVTVHASLLPKIN